MGLANTMAGIGIGGKIKTIVRVEKSQESMLGAPMFAAVAIDVENIDDHRQRDLVADSGVSLNYQ